MEYVRNVICKKRTYFLFASFIIKQQGIKITYSHLTFTKKNTHYIDGEKCTLLLIFIVLLTAYTLCIILKMIINELMISA